MGNFFVICIASGIGAIGLGMYEIIRKKAPGKDLLPKEINVRLVPYEGLAFIISGCGVLLCGIQTWKRLPVWVFIPVAVLVIAGIVIELIVSKKFREYTATLQDDDDL